MDFYRFPEAPLNEIFSPAESITGWSGSIVGALLFLAIGIGALVLPKLKKLIPNTRTLMVVNSTFIGIGLTIAALACWLGWFWLLIIGMSLILVFF